MNCRRPEGNNCLSVCHQLCSGERSDSPALISFFALGTVRQAGCRGCKMQRAQVPGINKIIKLGWQSWARRESERERDLPGHPAVWARRRKQAETQRHRCEPQGEHYFAQVEWKLWETHKSILVQRVETSIFLFRNQSFNESIKKLGILLNCSYIHLGLDSLIKKMTVLEFTDEILDLLLAANCEVSSINFIIKLPKYVTLLIY